MAIGAGIRAGAKCGFQIARMVGGPIGTGIGFILTNGVGIGLPTGMKKIGAGSLTTTVAGCSIPTRDGFGFRAMNGRRLGSIGGAAAIMSAGRRCRRMTTWLKLAEIPHFGCSCGLVIS